MMAKTKTVSFAVCATKSKLAFIVQRVNLREESPEPTLLVKPASQLLGDCRGGDVIDSHPWSEQMGILDGARVEEGWGRNL